jgi:hypothetical protein
LRHDTYDVPDMCQKNENITAALIFTVVKIAIGIVSTVVKLVTGIVSKVVQLVFNIQDVFHRTSSSGLNSLKNGRFVKAFLHTCKIKQCNYYAYFMFTLFN